MSISEARLENSITIRFAALFGLGSMLVSLLQNRPARSASTLNCLASVMGSMRWKTPLASSRIMTASMRS